MWEACGPVQINTGDKFKVGATRVTNNTAEMQGVVEALFWLNTCVHATSDVLITVLIEEKFVAKENRVLATLLRHMWIVTKERIRLHIRWIRGHTGDVGNSIADRLADAGTRQELQHQWWRRTPLNGGWDQEGFIENSASIQRETTACQEALRI